MRKIDMIVIHCSATRADVPLSPRQLDEMHRQRGFDGCGYHYYVRRDGEICTMRPVDRPGAHAKDTTSTVSVCATKEDWTSRDVLLIHVRNFRSVRSGCW